MTEMYKNLLALSIVIVALTVGGHYFFLSKLIKTSQTLEVANSDAEANLYLQNREWKLFPKYLDKLNKEYIRSRDSRFMQLEDVVKHANGEFGKLYDPTNVGQSVKQWKDGLIVFNYGEMFWDVKNSLKDRGVYLDDAVLGMDDKKTVPRQRIYRQLAHLHVVRELVLLAQKNRLRMSHPDMTEAWKSENGNSAEFVKHPAIVSILKARSYFVPEDPEAFADEFPVEMRVRGKLGDITKFLHGLTTNKHFLPLDRIQVKAIGAERYFKSINDARRSGENQVEARIICSGFLFLKDIKKIRNELLKSKGKQKDHSGA